MKTDDLINMLARGNTAPPKLPIGRITLFVAVGVLVSVALMLLFLGINPNLPALLQVPSLWIKFGFVISLAVVGWITVTKLSLPGRRTNKLPWAVALPLFLMTSASIIVLASGMPEERSQLFWGATWRVCPFLIAGLSLPIFIAVLRVMRELAPTRLHLAGAAAGFVAGATAACVYSLHCPEIAVPFVNFWYSLGILIPTVIGAIIGPQALRW
jgi:hypothetical protein